VLDELRVVDLSTEIAGPYCTKLLADAGADVVKIEAAEGDPLRRWRSGALFKFLNTSKRSIAGDPRDAVVRDLVVAADVVVESNGPGGTDVQALRALNPALVVVSISPFGLGGPWASRAATEFTLQAWCGSTGSRGTPERPPLAAGGRLGEWIGGAYAAVGAVAAWRQTRQTGRGEHIDVALLECMAMTMNTFTSVFADFLGWPDMRGPARTIEMPSVEPTADGYVGFCTITAQQFQDFLVLIERPDLLDDRDLANAISRARRMHEFLGIIHDWTTKRTRDEIIELATLMRIPVAPIGNGETLPTFDHFRTRGTFVENPDGGFVQPRVPYAIDGWRGRALAPAPALGANAGDMRWDVRPPRPRVETPDGTDDARPLDGVRIIDFTAFWAGPAATHMLAALGADVVKVESMQRPDGMRYATTHPRHDTFWEWGPVFHGANAGKRSITLAMNDPEGLALAKRLIADADAVIENFSPRVMENFGLTWDAVHDVNPRAVMVRMPAFGLDGPWRDRTGFAQTMEQITGMAWVTGFADGSPLIPRGACDPFAGMHAVLALLVALEARARSGSGSLVEVTMVEAALNAAAEQVVEYSAAGTLLGRDGNRGPVSAPQGLYPCRGEERWLALAIATDDHWAALCDVMGDPAWTRDVGDRRRDHDRIDLEIAAWCATRDLDELVEVLAARDVPAAPVVPRRSSFRATSPRTPNCVPAASSKRSSIRSPALTSCRRCRSVSGPAAIGRGTDRPHRRWASTTTRCCASCSGSTRPRSTASVAAPSSASGRWARDREWQIGVSRASTTM
jgi:crotonobetainyl-CoA:carnitine CoA-transferase CaiB-like acyl-CoA transferase